MKIVVAVSAHKQLLKLPRPIHSHIVEKIKLLSTGTIGLNIKKLTHFPEYRLRVGDYRVIYQINKSKKEITILSVKHRKDAYRK